jgi:predicted metal-binding protein
MKFRMTQVVQAARDAGFSDACPVRMSALSFHPETRELCEQNLCGKYGHNWSCPPSCPAPTEMAQRIKTYNSGILVQTRGKLDYEDDWQTIEVVRNIHNRRFYHFVQLMQGIYGKILPMGSGECRRCKRCGCPDEPCRHPDQRISSMEAYGLFIGDVCEASEMKYRYHADDRLMSLVSCILFQ